jgi:acyl-CoA synthetase (AMP-forming)/AMP-acid ligase II
VIAWADVGVRTVPGLLDEAARNHSDRAALIGGSRGRVDVLMRLTYGELRERALLAARGLSKLGLGRADRLGILLDNTCSIEAQVAYHAAHRVGAINVPLNTRLVAAELARAIELAGVSVVVAGPGSMPTLAEALRSFDRAPVVVEIAHNEQTEGATSWDAVLAGGPPLADRAPDSSEDADWIFTSGTTSTPKIAMFTHAASVACGYGAARAFALGPDTVYQSSSPFFTSTGIHTNPLGALVGGSTYLIDPDTDLGASLERAERYGTSVYFQVTTLLRLLIEERREKLAGLPKVRRVVYGGMPLSTEDHARLYDAVTMDLNRELVHCMGLTEGGPTGLFLTPDEGPMKPGSIGRTPFADWMQFCIVDADGHDVESGETGELCWRGPSVMRGYHGMDAGIGFLDGWLQTGDLVRQDDEGFVYFVSRKKDIIRRGGLNIAAAEVENVLRAAPGVRDAAVVPKPHDVLGEDLLAILEADADVDLGAVRGLCGERLAAYKIPRDMRVVSSLPRNAMGRVVKAELGEWVQSHV